MKVILKPYGFSDIIFAYHARSAYHLRSKYHAPKVHITRHKANITENDKFLCMDYKKDIFGRFAYELNSHIIISI